MSDTHGGDIGTDASAFPLGTGDRPHPWWSEAFAAGGAVLAGVGLLALGLDINKSWATVLIGAYVAVAYLVEPFLPRTGQAACTTIVALGTPTFVALVVLPIHTYNGARVLQIGTILLWLAFFLIGGTRGRVVLLALAVTFMWVFVTLEVGHVQSSARYLNPFGLSSRVLTPQISGTNEQCSLDSAGNQHCTFDGGDITSSPGISSSLTTRPKPLSDYALGIGLESLAFGAAFLYGVRRGERNGHRGRATAYVMPALLSLVVAVTALGDKVDHLWYAGVVALVTGLAIGAVANGHRRFITWSGAIMSAIGVTLIAGDLADSLWGHRSNSNRYAGLTFFVFGLATIFVAVVIARPLGESIPATPGS